ncbi:MAG: flagellar hook-length control protein FliK [Betaproteobacteria bacterium]|nr:flagellar hook-length control protein FliK [Betaproteobacteria bacterium]
MLTAIQALGPDLPAANSRTGEASDPAVGDGFHSALSAQMGEPAESGLASAARAYADDADKESAAPAETPTEAGAATPLAAPPSVTLPEALLAAAILPPPAPLPAPAAAPPEVIEASSAALPAGPMAQSIAGQAQAQAFAPAIPAIPAIPATPAKLPAAPAVEAAQATMPNLTGTTEISAPARVQAQAAQPEIQGRTTPETPAALAAAPVSDADATPAMPAMERQALPPAVLAAGPSEVATSRPDAFAATTPASPPTETGLARQMESFSRPAAQIMHMTVETPVRAPGFSTDFADKVVWMAGKREQWADLTLNPANLGSVEVRLSLSGDNAGAQFFSPNPQVREALEAALPRLRELLGQAGIALQDAAVHDQSLPQRNGSEGRAWGGRAEHAGEDAVAPAHTLPRTYAGRGLVDLYA